MRPTLQCNLCGVEYEYDGDTFFGTKQAQEWFETHQHTCGVRKIEQTRKREQTLAKLQRGIDLKVEVQRLFGYLDLVETSDSGKEYHPVILSCSRVGLQEGLEACLKRMKGLIDA